MLHPRVQIASRKSQVAKEVASMERETKAQKAVLASKKETTQELGGISLRTLDYMIARGEIKTVQLGKRRLIPRSEIDRIVRTAK
jgi:excisionase family DNA binding protein